MRMAWRALAIAAAGVVAIGLIGCDSGKEDPAQDDSEQPGGVPTRRGTGPPPGGARWRPPKKAPLVRTVAAEKARLAESLEATGEVVATRAVTIQATVEGPIAFCPWREGDRVEISADGPTKLIEIDRQLYRAEVQAAQAALAVAKAKLADLTADARPEEVAQAKEDVKKLEECARFARSDLDRVQKLVESGSVPGEMVEKARVAFVTCQTQLVSAKQKLAILTAGPTKTEIAVQQAAVDEARARLAVVSAKLAECTIPVPFAGVVTKVYVQPGDLATVRAPLLKMFDPASLVVRFAVPESQSTQVAPGAAVSIRLDAYPNRSFEGSISRVYPELDPKTRTRTVEAKLASGPDDLVPGMFARVDVAVREVPDAVVVPDSALLTMANGQTVVFVLVDGKAVLRKVRLGIERDRKVQVTEGVEPGELVIVAGNEGLKDGAAVRTPPKPQPAAATASGSSQ